MKGASSWCSCLIIRSFAATLAVSSKLNSWSNVSCEPNTSGIKKLSSAHSSCRFFCSGVPVSSSRLSKENCRSTTLSFAFSFFTRCASSITRNCHRTRLSVAFSMIAISYVVTTTSQSRSCARTRRSCSTRVSFVPWSRSARIDGQKRRSSFSQLPSVDSGTRIRCGPVTPRY